MGSCCYHKHQKTKGPMRRALFHNYRLDSRLSVQLLSFIRASWWIKSNSRETFSIIRITGLSGPWLLWKQLVFMLLRGGDFPKTNSLNSLCIVYYSGTKGLTYLGIYKVPASRYGCPSANCREDSLNDSRFGPGSIIVYYLTLWHIYQKEIFRKVYHKSFSRHYVEEAMVKSTK